MATDDRCPDAATGGRARPAISVLVPTFQGAGMIEGCLDSLAEQTMAPERFEVVVVVNGPSVDGTRDTLEAFAASRPELCVRVLEVREPGAAHARNVALAAARGDYVTFLDDDDRLTKAFLETVLAVADPAVVVAALVGDVPETAGPDDPADLDSYIGRALGRRVGDTVRAQDLVTALCYNAAKLVSADLARSVAYDTGLASGEDQVYWLSLFARRPFSIRVVDPADATYRRTVRPGSVSRQEMSHSFNVTQRLQCLRAMERVDRSAPAVRTVAESLMRSQAGFVNAYLRAHPDQHGAVVDEAARLGLREVPWSSVNDGLARDLAVSYNFPPWVDTSGIVAAKRLQQRGRVTDVVCQDLTGLRGRDARTTRVAAEVLGRVHVATGPASHHEWWGIAPFAEETWRFVVEQEAAQGAYRSVYSRAMAVGSPFAAALVKLRRPEVEWVAEFSDPLFIGLVGEQRLSDVADDTLSRELADGMRAAGFEVGDDLQVFEWAERLTYALADRIVFTNQLQRRMMLDRCEDARLVQRAHDRSVVEPHPQLSRRFYDMAESELVRTEGAVHLAYFGVFYATRDLGVLVDAVARLRQDERARVRLHVYTKRADELTLQIVRAGLAGAIVAHPYVSVLEFLNLTTKFDVLVVNDALTSDHHAVNPYLPSKLADYVGSGTPIWAIWEEGSTMSGMRFAHTSPVDDADAALGVLRTLIAERGGR